MAHYLRRRYLKEAKILMNLILFMSASKWRFLYMKFKYYRQLIVDNLLLKRSRQREAIENE
jgi:hypothetical protein